MFLVMKKQNRLTLADSICDLRVRKVKGEAHIRLGQRNGI